MTPDKYIVSKGWEGFGDRLQCLSYCINSALRYNRTLYVDWTDTIWGTSFYKYFYLVGVPFCTTDSAIAYKTIYPTFWDNKLMLPANNWVYDIRDQLLFEPVKELHYEDVWVHSGIGYRAYDFGQLVARLRLQESVAEYIRDRLPTTELPIVHLRGTDRKVSDESWAVLREKAPEALVLSDDFSLVQRWLSESPRSQAFSAPCDGITHFSKNVDKHRMNLSVLTDFFVLATAQTAYALNTESLFFSTARLFGKCGGASVLTNRFPPCVDISRGVSTHFFNPLLRGNL